MKNEVRGFDAGHTPARTERHGYGLRKLHIGGGLGCCLRCCCEYSRYITLLQVPALMLSLAISLLKFFFYFFRVLCIIYSHKRDIKAWELFWMCIN